MAAWDSKGTRFEITREGGVLTAEEIGTGAPIVLLHGITASRRYVVHGSTLLARRDRRAVAYDARGHGESDPAPEGAGYRYAELADDLDVVLDAVALQRRAVIAGNSMGAHTVVASALREPERIAAIVVIGPAYAGVPTPEEALARWDELADGLEEGGVEGFMAAYERQGLDPEWREVLLRITRERMLTHEHPDAVAEAIRQLPRDAPFDGLSELEFCDLPALVVASHDEADPGHPYAVAEAYAARLPRARLISEQPGESPLAWQGGRLSREIAAFCDQPEVAERLES